MWGWTLTSLPPILAARLAPFKRASKELRKNRVAGENHNTPRIKLDLIDNAITALKALHKHSSSLPQMPIPFQWQERVESHN